jgi:5'-deoxynucleotidase YfbR-like HD superfamily hydrolase
MSLNINTELINNCIEWRGDWIQTYSGKRFFPLDPRPEDVCIEDIAHALSLLCRWTGHVKEFYCPTLDHKILTSDLRWVPAGDIRLGDKLVGFDEFPVERDAAGNLRRKYRPSIVIHSNPVKRDIIRLELNNGQTIKSSYEHPWLVATKQSRNQKWISAIELFNDITNGKRRYMHCFMDMWDENLSKSAGWLSGMYGGEGFLSILNRFGILRPMDGEEFPLEIIGAYKEKRDWVAGIETSTHTYICDGFAAHNSVAQHSLIVSGQCQPENALWGLLHDASEAYISDISRPLKREKIMDGYRDIENKIMTAVALKFNLSLPSTYSPLSMPKDVKEADNRVLQTEGRDLLGPLVDDWKLADPYDFTIRPLHPRVAQSLFMERFYQLYSEENNVKQEIIKRFS